MEESVLLHAVAELIQQQLPPLICTDHLHRDIPGDRLLLFSLTNWLIRVNRCSSSFRWKVSNINYIYDVKKCFTWHRSWCRLLLVTIAAGKDGFVTLWDSWSSQSWPQPRLAPRLWCRPPALKVLRIDKFWIFRYELSILIRMCSLSIVGYFWFPKVETCRIRIISVCTENMG